jgi:hypothetical protein
MRCCCKASGASNKPKFSSIKPANLPVETAESFLTINLKTDKIIGLDISDEILRQADTTIR